MRRPQLTTNILVFLWLVVYSRFIYAATTELPPFSQDWYSLDFESIGWAAVAGLLGGALRTVLSLSSEKVVIGSLWRELVKDLIVAAVGGLVAYGAVNALAPYFPQLFTSQARMLAITGVGFSRGAWTNWLEVLVAAALTRVRNQVEGGAAAPSSIRAPLEDKP